MVRFSVIVPVYNVAPYLRECLSSVVKATEQVEKVGGGGQSRESPLVEVICVDDGSTDGSGEILDEYAERVDKDSATHLHLFSPPRFRVIHQPNRGVSAARNAGLEVATGEWAWFVDSDDLVHPDAFRVVALCIADNPTADIVKIRCFSGERLDGPWGRCKGVEPLLVKADNAERAILGLQGASQYLMRRSVIGDLRFEPYRWLEDVIFVVRYLAKCRDLLLVPALFYFYRNREGSAIHSRHSAEDVAEIFRALNVLVKAAESLVRRCPDVDFRRYWKNLHAFAYFAFGGAYFRLPARERGKLLDEWLCLQARFAGRYPVPLEWRLRIALVRFAHSGLLVRPLVLWGATLRGKAARCLSWFRGGCN